MEKVNEVLSELFESFGEISGRNYSMVEKIGCEDAEDILVLLGSSYDTAIEAVEEVKKNGKKVGVATIHVLRPFPSKELYEVIGKGKRILVADGSKIGERRAFRVGNLWDFHVLVTDRKPSREICNLCRERGVRLIYRED